MGHFTFQVEMNFSGNYSPPIRTDVTADVRSIEPILCERGIRERGPTARVAAPGTLTFALDNSAGNSAGLAGYYALWHANKRAGFDFNNPVYFSILDGTNKVVVFAGRIVDITTTPGSYGLQLTYIRALDVIGLWRERTVEGISAQLNQATLDVITTILDANDPEYDPTPGLGMYIIAREPGSTGSGLIMPIASDRVEDERTTIREELHRIAMTEQGYLFLPHGGLSGLVPDTLRFQFRDVRSLNPAVDVSLAAFHDLAIPNTREEIADKVSVTAYPYQEDTVSTTVLYSLQSTGTLVHPGEVYTSLFGPFRDPNNPGERCGGRDFQAITATTDYTMNAAQDGSGADLTANFTVVASTTANGVRWTITNNGTTAGYITKLQLRGKGIYRRPIVIEATNPNTPAAYGKRTVSFSLPYQADLRVAQEVAEYYADLYYAPDTRRVNSVRFLANYNAALMTAGRTADIGDRVRLSEPSSGLSNAEFYIQGIRYEALAGGILWVTWYLETETMALWTTPTFAAGDYTANGSMTWTVAAGDITTMAYQLIGKRMLVSFWIATTTVGGTLNTTLRIKIPASKTAAKYMLNPILVSDNGSRVMGMATVDQGGTVINLQRQDQAVLQAATDNTAVYGQIEIEVQ